MSVIYIISIFISFRRNLVYLLGTFKYINLDTNFKPEKDKKDYSTYLGINLGEVRNAL